MSGLLTRDDFRREPKLVRPRTYISVLPKYQRKGVGTMLIQEGLSLLKDLNAQGCCLVGHPDYYKRFGFRNISGLILEGVPQEVFLALPFREDPPQGIVVFHEGFKADGQNAFGSIEAPEGLF